jgi:hypothetical protein
MSKEEFLARCANAYDAGLCTPERLRLLERWLDFVLRFEGGQMSYVAEFMDSESERTNHFRGSKTLASDRDGYSLIEFAAILSHHCQQCATSRDAWWTRPAFCDHKREAVSQ